MSDLVEPLEELKLVDEEEVLHPVVEEESQVMEKEPVEELKPMDGKEKAFHPLVEDEFRVSMEVLNPVVEEESQVMEKEPVGELKPMDDKEKVFHSVVEDECQVSKEPVEELKPMDDKEKDFHSLLEEECPVSKEELKCDQKPPFTFEWVEVSSDTVAEYPAVQEDCPVNKEELLVSPVMEEERLASPPESVTQATEPDPLEYYTFCLTNPRFDLLMAYSHLKPRYHVILPPQITRKLPEEKISVVLNSYGKKWTMWYNGHLMSKTLARGWKAFAVENELKIGDCCFFELTEKSKDRVEFKVVIVKTGRRSKAVMMETEPHSEAVMMETEPHSEAEVVGSTLQEPILIE